MEETGFSLDDRILCSDEACIGTIGPDGRCKVCGKQYEGDEDVSAMDASGVPKSLLDAEGQEVESLEEPDSEPAGDFDPDERVCCPDETCVGIIGPDGKCGTCGKAL